MKVRVDELPESGTVIHFHKTDAWFSSRMSSTEHARKITLARPVNADLELVPESDHVKLSGQLQTAVRLSCSRCLQHFATELEESFVFTLLRPLAAGTPEEIDLRPQDLDTAFYDGVTIDVDLIVCEQIFLALPQKPLCRSDCPGLCPVCGVDLNQGLCHCEKTETESAFDVLRSMKIGE